MAYQEIPLSQNYVTIIDDCDFQLIKNMKWHLHKRSHRKLYAASNIILPHKKSRRIILLHRFIMKPPMGVQVDHINGDGLDNRRSNLRICSHAENQWNSKDRDSESRFKGVSRNGNKWRARLRCCGKQITIGNFPTEEEAAQAYNIAVKQYHREFSYIQPIIDAARGKDAAP